MRLASKSRVGVGRKDLIVNVADQFEDKGCAPAEQNHTVCRLEASQEPPLFGEDQVAKPDSGKARCREIQRRFESRNLLD